MDRLPDTSWLDADPRSGVRLVVGRYRLVSDVLSELMDDLARGDMRIVVCDLADMAAAPVALGQLFAPVAAYLAAWPGTLVVLRVPEDAAGNSPMVPEGIPGRLLVHSSVQAGVRAARELMAPLEQTNTHLAPVPATAAGARDFVIHALDRWHLGELAWPASLVTSELVTNALLHSGTVVDLNLGHVHTRLRIAVHDRGGGAPAIPAATDTESATGLSGRGLQLVDAETQAWGVFPTRDAGKTVWAVLGAA